MNPAPWVIFCVCKTHIYGQLLVLPPLTQPFINHKTDHSKSEHPFVCSVFRSPLDLRNGLIQQIKSLQNRHFKRFRPNKSCIQTASHSLIQQTILMTASRSNQHFFRQFGSFLIQGSITQQATLNITIAIHKIKSLEQT